MADNRSEKVWLITGCSTGFGHAIATRVLERGYRAVVTARKVASLEDLVTRHAGMAAAVAMDVTDRSSVARAISASIERFGEIDVLVNNAGLGYFSAFEESDEKKVRELFDVNFFGLASVTTAVLPHMRARRKGHIVNVASAGAIIAFPAVGYYNASKWAVLGLSESIAKEVAPLGIRVTVAAPSGIRVRSAEGAAHFEVPKIENEDYVPTVGAMRDGLVKSFGKQPGDPLRMADAIVDAVEDDRSPFRLLLGKAAVTYARQRAREVIDDASAWEKVSLGVDFPDAAVEKF